MIFPLSLLYKVHRTPALSSCTVQRIVDKIMTEIFSSLVRKCDEMSGQNGIMKLHLGIKINQSGRKLTFDLPFGGVVAFFNFSNKRSGKLVLQRCLVAVPLRSKILLDHGRLKQF